jgi:hypothetical protein
LERVIAVCGWLHKQTAFVHVCVCNGVSVKWAEPWIYSAATCMVVAYRVQYDTIEKDGYCCEASRDARRADVSVRSL